MAETPIGEARSEAIRTADVTRLPRIIESNPLVFPCRRLLGIGGIWGCQNDDAQDVDKTAGILGRVTNPIRKHRETANDAPEARRE
jgi:hypothetical protein